MYIKLFEWCCRAKLNRVSIVTEPRLGYGRTNPYTLLSQPSIPPSDLDLVSCLLVFGDSRGVLKDSK